MKTRALVVSALAGLATTAMAQPTLPAATVTYSLTWENSVTHDHTALSTGQSAIFHLIATMAPESGTAGTWGTVVSPGGSGTYRGIQALFTDIVGGANTAGTWNVAQAQGYGIDPDGLWDVTGGQGNGISTLSGARLTNIQAGQFPASQNAVNTANPATGTNTVPAEVGYWNGVWTPASYAARTVTWTVANGSANPGTQSNALIVRDPTANSTVFVGTGVDNFGTAQSVGIIPGPSSLALLGLGGLIAARRRRA